MPSLSVPSQGAVARAVVGLFLPRNEPAAALCSQSQSLRDDNPSPGATVQEKTRAAADASSCNRIEPLSSGPQAFRLQTAAGACPCSGPRSAIDGQRRRAWVSGAEREAPPPAAAPSRDLVAGAPWAAGRRPRTRAAAGGVQIGLRQAAGAAAAAAGAAGGAQICPHAT